MEWKNIQHYVESEWSPHSEKVNPALIYLMDRIREIYGKKIFIHCAWANSGHSSKSQHYLGKAVDFHFEDDDYDRQFMIMDSIPVIGGIGAYLNTWNNPGWHLDIRPNRLYWRDLGGNVYEYGKEAVLKDIEKAMRG